MGSKIEVCEPPRFDLKIDSVIEMTFLYDARYLVVLLRQKKVQLLTQSAEKWICMGNWVFEILAILFLKDEKAPDNQIFLI